MSTFTVFLSLYFFVLFLYTFTTTIHLWSFMRKTFLCTSIFFIHDKPFSVHTLELFSLHHTVYIQTLFTFKDFSFFPTHTYSSHKSSFIYTRCSHTQEFLSTHHLHTKTFYTHFPFTYMYR